MSKQTGWREDGKLLGLFYRADVGFGYLYSLEGIRSGNVWLRKFRHGIINSRKASSWSAERHRIHFSGVDTALELKSMDDDKIFFPGLTDLNANAFTVLCNEYEICRTQNLFPGPKNEVRLD